MEHEVSRSLAISTLTIKPVCGTPIYPRATIDFTNQMGWDLGVPQYLEFPKEPIVAQWNVTPNRSTALSSTFTAKKQESGSYNTYSHRKHPPSLANARGLVPNVRFPPKTDIRATALRLPFTKKLPM